MRPEGWENPHNRVQKFKVEELLKDAYEAGADAMLEGLIKECRVERPIEWLHSLNGKGYLVFIEEE